MTAPMQPITRIQDLRPGDIGLGPIHGLVGAAVGAGQWALGEGWRLAGDHEVQIRHACIVVKPAMVAGQLDQEITQDLGNPFVAQSPTYVEAMPSGARYARGDRWTDEWSWVRLPEDYPGQGVDAAYVASLMADEDIPYSPLSYGALAAWRAHLPVPHVERWINRRRPGSATWLPSGAKMTAGLPAEAICSVLVDQAWTLTGKSIMTGVPHQCVTPKALGNRLRFGTPGAVWAFPRR